MQGAAKDGNAVGWLGELRQLCAGCACGPLLRALLWTLLPALAACSPTLNWREVRLPGQAQMLFPCKPERVERRLPLAGVDVAATMLACEADGLTWSATAFELPDDARRDQALRELRHLLAMNLRARELFSAPMAAPGLTPSPEARRLRLAGQRQDGSPVQAEALFAADGHQALQLVVLVPMAQATAASGQGSAGVNAVDEFFTALRRSGPGAS